MAHEIDRRQFLAGLATLGVAGVLPRSVGPRAIGPRLGAFDGPALMPRIGAGEHTLVLITLYGGNDGLNTVIPIDDPAYTALRSNLAINRSAAIDLGSGFALNGAMPGLAGLWHSGQLAIVRGVGYPNPSLSHFQSMDIWQSGSPKGDVASGWLGRWLDRVGKDPLTACSIGPNVLPAMAGDRRKAAALQDSSSPYSQLPEANAHLLKLYREIQHVAPGDSALEGSIAQSGTDMLTVSHTAATALRKEPPLHYSGSAGDIGNQLGVVSQLIRAGLPTAAFAVNQGGYDTHSGELATQNLLLGQLDRAITGFLASIAGTPRGRATTIVVYSEFGRRVESNGSLGTDHGTANTVFAVGPLVRGGFYGDQPSLTRLDDNGNMLHTVDFRSVYATLLEGVLAIPARDVLGHAYPTLGFL